MTGGITGASIPPVFLSAGERHRLVASTAARLVEATAIRLTIFEERALGVGFLQSLGNLPDPLANFNDAREVAAGSGQLLKVDGAGRGNNRVFDKALDLPAEEGE